MAVMADKQVILEATIEIPPSFDEPLLYLFALHYFLPLLRTPNFRVMEVLCHLLRQIRRAQPASITAQTAQASSSVSAKTVKKGKKKK